MGKELIRNRVLSLIWYFKVLVALCIAFGGMFFLSNRVYVLRSNKLEEARNTSQAITIDSNSETCQAANQVRRRIEPPDGTVYIGFHLNWEILTPVGAAGLIGRNPAIINAFLDLDDNAAQPFDINMMAWQASEIQKVNGIYALTMQPNALLGSIREETYDSLARECLKINEKGIPVFLRWGHEMNGDWASYGLKPVDYVRSFRQMTRAVRRYTNLTAMVWAPNVGINYPFRGGGQVYPTNVTDPENFAALDTNSDGILDHLDDPYLPYFPGDEFVDWFGISIYWYPDELVNGPVWEGYFRDNMRGSGPTIERMNNLALLDGGLRNFYGRFPQAFNKPIMMPETAGPWFPDPRAITTQTELQVKQAWWRQIFSQDTFRDFPLLKAVVQFEEIKRDGIGELRDFRVLNNPLVRRSFREDIDALPNLLWAQDLRFGCGGQVATN